MRLMLASCTPEVAAERYTSIYTLVDNEGARENVNELVFLCHTISVESGWWHSMAGEPLELNFGERIALIHSELSEALEGGRKDLESDHIEGFSAVEEELADALIRLFDTAGAYYMDRKGEEVNIRLGAAFVAKLAYNRKRADHKPEVRAAEGGKEF